jgi:arabinose-5-phosphate isomerase
MLNKFEDFSHLTAQNIMSINGLTIDAESLAAKAGNYMQDKKITQLIVTQNSQYLGLIHLHDLYSEGII